MILLRYVNNKEMIMKVMLKKMVSTKFMDIGRGIYEAEKIGDNRYRVFVDKVVSIIVDKKSVKEIE
jgi:hypothetical protein